MTIFEFEDALDVPCALVHGPEDPCCICGEPTSDGFDNRPAYLLQRLDVFRAQFRPRPSRWHRFWQRFFCDIRWEDVNA